MSTPFPPGATRQALLEALPEPDQAGSLPAKPIGFTWAPPTHARALDPDNTLVVGIRGAGKSFWWAALHSAAHRTFVARAFPESRLPGGMQTRQAWGLGLANEQAPGRDTLAALVADGLSPRQIWRAVVGTQLDLPAPFPTTVPWADKARWVTNHPEQFDALVGACDQQLAAAGSSRLLLFDALDRLADDWPAIRPLAQALLALALDLRATRAIRAKLFVRPDMLEDRGILAFPDASKLLARKADLTWRQVDLYALLLQCLGNAPTQGDQMRRWIAPETTAAAGDCGSPWVLPPRLRADEAAQKALFHAITGPAMAGGASGHKRGFPYTWLPNHLMDGRGQVSPRSFCAALAHAAQADGRPADWQFALHWRDIQAGVQQASRIRVDEFTREDYPWVAVVMEPLKGRLSVPCPPEQLEALWREAGVLEQLRGALATDPTQIKLPPRHLETGTDGLLKDLEALGLVQRLRDGRVQIPDVYRVAFGLGRRGGVRPLK